MQRSGWQGVTLPTHGTLYPRFSLALFLSQHQFGVALKKKRGGFQITVVE